MLPILPLLLPVLLLLLVLRRRPPARGRQRRAAAAPKREGVRDFVAALVHQRARRRLHLCRRLLRLRVRSLTLLFAAEAEEPLLLRLR